MRTPIIVLNLSGLPLPTTTQNELKARLGKGTVIETPRGFVENLVNRNGVIHFETVDGNKRQPWTYDRDNLVIIASRKQPWMMDIATKLGIYDVLTPRTVSCVVSDKPTVAILGFDRIVSCDFNAVPFIGDSRTNVDRLISKQTLTNLLGTNVVDYNDQDFRKLYGKIYKDQQALMSDLKTQDVTDKTLAAGHHHGK